MAEEFVGPKELIPRVSREDGSNVTEGRVFVGAPDFRVFIWGAEVSADVFSVTTTLTLDENVSTAMLNIVNDNEKWILPTSLGAIPFDVFPDELSDRTIRGSGGQLSGGLAPDTTSRKPGTYLTPMQFAKKKQKNFKRYLSSIGPLGERIISHFQNSNHFPFLPGAPLIQAGDRIRIFWKNPWCFQGGDNVQTFSPEEWYFAFTGFIATVTEDFDATTNKSLLRVQCEDIRRLLRYMRVTTNPNIFHLDQVTESDLDARTVVTSVAAHGSEEALPTLRQLAGDTVLFSGNASPLAGQVIVDRTSEQSRNGMLEFMLMGAQNEELASVPGKRMTADGVLGFRQGGKRLVVLPTDKTFEKGLSDTMDLIYPRLTEDEVDAFGSDWSLGSDPTTLTEIATTTGVAVDANRLWVILPDEAAFPDKRYPFDWQPRIDFFSEWRSRLDLINEFVKNLDCVWYATPKGDIVFEFPNYDSIPMQYADQWRSVFLLQNEFKGFSSTEDDRNIKTLTIGVASPVDQLDLGRGAPFLSYSRVINPELVARYGIREQRQNRPFHYKEDTVAGSLNALTSMWQELANADAFRLEGVECLPNFRGCPGRPYFFKFRNLIGYAEMVQHQVVWGSLAQTIYGFKYVRHFDIDTGTWRKISGNYGWNWVNANANPQAAKGLDPVAKGADTVVSRQLFGPDSSDQTAKIMRANLLTIPQDRLTDDQRTRAEQIVTVFETSTPTPEEHLRLKNEFTSIMARARG